MGCDIAEQTGDSSLSDGRRVTEHEEGIFNQGIVTSSEPVHRFRLKLGDVHLGCAVEGN